MLLAYVDESYSKDWFAMSALLVDGPATVALSADLDTEQGEFALVIADEVDGQAQHRADLSTYRDVGTTGYRQRRLTRIVDTLHFAPSHASRLVQAADVITFLYRRVHAHVETDDRARRAKIAMWGRLAPRIQHANCWFPKWVKGHSETWGHDLLRDAQRARQGGP